MEKIKKLKLIFFIPILFFIFTFVSMGENFEEYSRGRIVSLEKSFSVDNMEIEKMDLFKVEILSGKDKGKMLFIEHPTFAEKGNNIPISPGDKVVILKDYIDNPEGVYYIADRDKRGWMIGLLGIMAVMTVAIARFRGVKALGALIITGLIISDGFIPGIIQGYSPILLAVIVSFVASGITIFFMSGFTPKGYSALLGAISGVLVSGLLSYLFTNFMGLTGYSTIEIINMASYLENINLKEIISAGIILGSMGAVMDVAMSIASALNEIKEKDPDITNKELFKSGINIGSDVIGTMINTLILAYIGSFLVSMVLISLQRNQYPLIRILNFEFIAVEILRSFCGSIGILAAVPATAFFSGFLQTGDEKIEEESSH